MPDRTTSNRAVCTCLPVLTTGQLRDEGHHETWCRTLRVVTWNDQGQRFETERGFRLYGCAKRGCDEINLDFEAFGGHGGKSYCLHHIPLRSRFKLWRQRNA